MFETIDGLEVRNGPRDPVPFAVFENEIPTAQQVEVVRSRGFGMHFLELPAKYRDLGFLAEYSPFLRHISVADATCTNVSVLTQLSELVGISLYVNQESDVDLSVLPNLEFYDGLHKHFESIGKSLTLKHLALQEVNGRKLGPIAGPLEYLELIDAKTLASLPVLDQPEHLRYLWILGPRQLTLTSLERFTNLQTLSLESCGSVTGIDEVLRAPALKGIGLVSCREVEPREALLQFQGESVTVIGRNPFDEDFKARALATRPTWLFRKSR